MVCKSSKTASTRGRNRVARCGGRARLNKIKPDAGVTVAAALWATHSVLFESLARFGIAKQLKRRPQGDGYIHARSMSAISPEYGQSSAFVTNPARTGFSGT